MGRVLRAAVWLVFVSSVGFGSETTQEQPSAVSAAKIDSAATNQLFGALDRQDSWLATSPNGDAWRTYLKSDKLREVVSADSLDLRFLAEVLGRYESHAPGLSAGPFQATRIALTRVADQAGVPMTIRWAAQLRAAAPYRTDFSKQTLLDAKYELIDAKVALNQYLRNGDADTRKGWHEFLMSDVLDEQLKADTPDWKELDKVQLQYLDGHPGLEFPSFVRVRKALQKYSFIGKLFESGQSKESIEQYAAALTESLEEYNDEQSTKNAGKVATLLNWMRIIGRDAGLAQDVRNRHSVPNISIRLAEHFLQRRFQRDVNDSTPVNEMILQTHVRGTATTRGKVTANVVNNPHVAQIDIMFDGVTDTVSVGRQKPVTIRSSSTTILNGRKPLYLYPTRLSSEPAAASGSTSNRIHSITPDMKIGARIIERIAWGRANEQKPQTEAIAAYRAARRLERKIDEQTTDLLNGARDSLRSQFSGPLNQRGLIPETIRTSSDDHAVYVHGTQADDGQLAATSPPPFFSSGDSVIAQIHESAINNTAEKAIAGLRLTDERIVEVMKELKLDIPDELKISEDKTPWSMSFDWNQPVTVEFDDQQLTISIRGRRFTRGDNTLKKALEISATYSMEALPEGVVLKRQGDVNVTMPGNDGALRAGDRIFKTLMEKKFGQLFKPLIQGNGFTLPGRFGEMGVIRLHRLSTENGWLSLGWQ